ncbi:t-SNARE [Gloeophyllum trabeum ATCC 11539]|uniref:t-SNARE n=1 Tax=Gloeophyllum trabeum (strain ATCC 11539 / FP-39264 / Madison 617) TaxID=670483 RepID=S7QGA9_GLOTA|nr:t-SNARE [Gloeophyllum trabeum ATCC 11539]EPQ58228.1 t-SNARE [Gloeophyllum trabeum ATCC 11539]
MAMDRLAALRAQRGQGDGSYRTQGQGQGRGYEMSGVNPPSNPQPAYGANGNGAGEGMTDFYGEIGNIQDMIAQFDSNVSRISDLHSRVLNNMDEAQSNRFNAELDELVGETRSLSGQIKRRIESLGAQPTPGADARIKKNQLSLVRKKFMEVVQKYQNVEADYRSRYKQRVERQFKIVKPDATQEEVAAVVNNSSGTGNQIFAQAISSSTRYGESRAAYREVQERHEDIRKIEQTLAELAQLFNDMSILVQQQDEQIDAVQTAAAGVEKDTEAALGQTEKAVVSARKARRKRWICFWLTILIAIIIAVIIVVSIRPWQNKGNNNGGS